VSTVAERFSSSLMKRVMRSGFVVTMVKYLDRWMFSITESTTSALASSPSREKSPVSIPKTTPASVAIRKSVQNSALPMSRSVYLRKIIATMSVPPVLPCRLNRIALPTAGSRTEKTSSSMGCVVSGASMGTRRSSA